MPTTTKPRYYFGYGSNLWLNQMKERCPNSPYHTRAFLENWKFIIYPEGYATVTDRDIEKGKDKVWGSIYILDPEDEKTLDEKEGVAEGKYDKMEMMCVFCPPSAQKGKNKWERKCCLVYVAKDQRPGTILDEYIVRMSNGIADADLPKEYVHEVLHEWMYRKGPCKP